MTAFTFDVLGVRDPDSGRLVTVQRKLITDGLVKAVRILMSEFGYSQIVVLKHREEV